MRGDRGAAAIDFVLVTPMVVGLCFAVVHIGTWMISMTDAHRLAFEAARKGILTPGGPREAVTAAQRELSRRLADDGDGSVHLAASAGSAVVVVQIAVPLRVLEWDSPVQGTASAHLPLEPR